MQALAPLGIAPAPLGVSAAVASDEPLLFASGGDERDLSLARMVSRRPFSGYWEYHIEGALFTAPARTDHSGAGLFNAERRAGRRRLAGGRQRLGEGSGPAMRGNMFVPVDLLKPILAELKARGSSRNSSRAWLGLNCVEVGGQVHVVRLSADSPAEAAGLQPKDVIVAIDGVRVADLASMYRTLWRGDRPDRDVVLDILRDGAGRCVVGACGRQDDDVEPASGRVSRALVAGSRLPARGIRIAPSPLRSPPSGREGPAPLGPFLVAAGAVDFVEHAARRAASARTLATNWSATVSVDGCAAMCGVIVMPGTDQSGSSAGSGSRRWTSSAAPLRCPERTAAIRSASTMCCAARDVDDVAAARHARERARVEDAFGLARQRQARRRRCRSAPSSCSNDSGERRFQPRTTRPQRSSQARDLAAHRAGAEHADAVARDRQRPARPVASALLRFVALERARMAQRHRDDELGDPRRLLAIDDARDANLRRELGREQLLDPGRDRAHPAQARQARRQAGRHLPAEDDVDIGELGVAQRRAVFEQLEIGRAGADRLDEQRRRHRLGREQDFIAVDCHSRAARARAQARRRRSGSAARRRSSLLRAAH